MKSGNTIKAALSVIITGAMLTYFIRNADLVRSIFAEVNLEILCKVTLIYWLTAFVKIARLKFIYSDIPFLNLFSISSTHNVINNSIPFRVGDLSFPFLCSKMANTAMSRSLHDLVVIRFYDFWVLLAMMGSCLVMTFLPSLWVVIFFSSFGMVLVFAPLSVIVLKSVLPKIYTPERSNRPLMIGRFDFNKPINLLLRERSNRDLLYEGVIFSLFSFLIWSLTVVAMATVLASINPIPFIKAFQAAIIAQLVNFIPINGIAGIGGVQLTWGLGLKYINQSFVEGISYGLVIHVVFYLNSVFFGLLGFLTFLTRHRSIGDPA